MESLIQRKWRQEQPAAKNECGSKNAVRGIRLLFATPEPCPTFRADVAVLFGKYLPRFGVRSDLVTDRAPGVSGEPRWEGGQAYLASARHDKVRKHLLKLAHYICVMFRADRDTYQAIQVRDMPLVGLIGLLAARARGLRFFYWMSFPTPEYHIKLAEGRRLSAGVVGYVIPWVRGRVEGLLLYRLVLRWADHVFVQSLRMRTDVADMGVPWEKITPVPMGVDTEVTRPELVVPSSDSRLVGRRVLVYLGTLDRNRRIDFLFEVLSIVRQVFPQALLVLVGQAEDDAHERWLRLRARQTGVMNDIIWTGWLPVDEAWKYVRAAEIGLSPFPRGPLLDSCSPTKLLEYLALNVPVVGNENPDQGQILREGGGGLCVPLEPSEFAHAVCRLLTDETLCRAMASSGRRYVLSRRSYDSLARCVASAYAELLNMPAVT
jgi:glycosyltransferase involved in cell wall biosynthesis